MIITFLYAIWILYTVGSLSAIALLITLTYLGKVEQKRRDKSIRELIKARPVDEVD